MRNRVIGLMAGTMLLGSGVAHAETAPTPMFSENGNFVERMMSAWEQGLDAPTEPASTTIDLSGCFAGPLDSPPFPNSSFSYGGNPGMCNPGSVDRGPFMKALAPTSVGQWLDDHRISIYGWVEPSINVSSSKSVKNGNAPAAYYYDANRPLFDQATIYIERTPDTVQNDHVDWGFRVTNIYGSDYRYTTMYGLASNRFLTQNSQNGWDIPMAFFDLYVPNVGYGTNFRIGRYISVPDIEAQLAPDNYFFSHSLLYATDPYTQVGLIATTKLDPKGQWQIQYGISAGNDVTPWAGQKQPQPTFTFGVNYTTSDERDNIYVVANSINDGKFGYNNLQSYYFTWYHVFPNQKWHTATETWYMYENSTPNSHGGLAQPFTTAGGQPYGFGAANGPFGAYCKTGTVCTSYEDAIINYTMYEFNKHNSVGLRNELYNDAMGQRTGQQTVYYEATVGWNHYFSDDIYIRPEFGFYHSFHAKAFDNGTRHDAAILATDLIIRY